MQVRPRRWSPPVDVAVFVDLEHVVAGRARHVEFFNGRFFLCDRHVRMPATARKSGSGCGASPAQVASEAGQLTRIRRVLSAGS